MIELTQTGPTTWDVHEVKNISVRGDGTEMRDQEAREFLIQMNMWPGATEEETRAEWKKLLQPPVPTPHDVKQEAGRRILAQYPIWKQMNLMGEGGPSFTEMSAAILAIRAKSNDIEAMEPIPEDFRSDSYWSA